MLVFKCITTLFNTRGGGGQATGGGEIWAGREAKICAKYAQICAKICATLKMGSGWLPYISSPRHFYYKIWWYFWSERSADHFKSPQGTFLIFFPKKIGILKVQKIWRSKNIHPKPIILVGLPRKIEKYVQNMRKYAQICAILKNRNMRKICANMWKYAQHIFPPCGLEKWVLGRGVLGWKIAEEMGRFTNFFPFPR